MIDIILDDIRYAEKKVLPEGEEFNQERRKVIQSMETNDIQACPGSGKTTTLLAKLSVISRKLPLNQNNGICVLTHTNVGINEVKERLGIEGSKLFNYPNHCGTIQSFVNKYLAIPAYIKLFGKRPLRIDDEIYYETIKKKYGRIVPRRLRYGVEQKDSDLIFTMRYNLDNFHLVKGIYGNQILKSRSTDTYKALKKLKYSTLESGVLCYDDAYALANWYLKEYPNLKKIYSKRFAYVFIDEMQDTMKHQNEVLNRLFDDSVVIQRIGDTNQSIYDNKDAEGVWEVDDNCLSISNSKRFSKAIANIVRPICIRPQQLEGNSNIPNIDPVLIVFNETHINKVLPLFGELVIQNKLHVEPNNNFKAIGWVANENSKGHTLIDYWSNFNKEYKVKNDYNHLKSYLEPQHYDLIKSKGAKIYRKSILKALLKALRIMKETDINNRFYTERSLYTFLNENHNSCYDKLMLNLASWVLEIQRGNDIYESVKGFIENEFKSVFTWNNTSALEEFFKLAGEVSGYSVSSNIYNYRNKGGEVKIELDTIHGVKGETHTATLYLETFYHGYDVSRIIEYLKGNHQLTQKKRTIQNLKMAYVGMTRPSHLLCVAVHEESIKGHQKQLEECGWRIINL
ncbi:UvrD-helicase domain-containing protein [Halobacillus seohaensis]|uniref:UvrD-helicase domain-containing protein n=1 Tax=Halobacillus seohaensis TaxID=447421 RepID=A0ABW2EH93_9BACI